MNFIITKEMKATNNDWCGVEPETYKLLFRAKTLKGLMKKVNGADIIVCRNWFRPLPLNTK